MYEHPDRIGRNVVIVGGGLTGCEGGIFLAGQGRRVTIVEMKPELCRDAPYLHREAVLLELERLGAVTRAGTRCTRIFPDGISAEKDGLEQKFTADTVIIAAGVRPRTEEAESFRVCADEFWKAGDCKKAGNVRMAVHEGYDAGSCIE
jgi:pyruvate/2-oxoglutarate dehydrogenase complex dihydrolipoamide dehydrogenase (E3) component